MVDNDSLLLCLAKRRLGDNTVLLIEMTTQDVNGLVLEISGPRVDPRGEFEIR